MRVHCIVPTLPQGQTGAVEDNAGVGFFVCPDFFYISNLSHLLMATGLKLSELTMPTVRMIEISCPISASAEQPGVWNGPVPLVFSKLNSGGCVVEKSWRVGQWQILVGHATQVNKDTLVDDFQKPGNTGRSIHWILSSWNTPHHSFTQLQGSAQDKNRYLWKSALKGLEKVDW